MGRNLTCWPHLERNGLAAAVNLPGQLAAADSTAAGALKQVASPES
jgi:hypothetical protein